MREHLSNEQLALFCQNMGMMYQAGIQTDEALRLVAQDSDSDAFGTVLQQAADAMDDGTSYPEALRASGAFPAYAVKMIEIASKAGRLEPTMFALGGYYLEQMHIQDRLRSALVYPMVLLVLMCCVLLVLSLQVLPLFLNVYKSMAAQLSTASYDYIAAAQTISTVAVVIVFVVACCFLVGSCFVYFGRKTTTVMHVIDRLPSTSATSYAAALSRVMTALATYTASGIDAESALRSIAPEIGNKKLSSRLNVCLEHIAAGTSFAQAAYDEQLLAPLYGRMLINAERSGTFDDTLSYLAELIGDDASHQMDRVIGSIEPICAAFLTIAVALALIAIVIPLMGILGALG